MKSPFASVTLAGQAPGDDTAMTLRDRRNAIPASAQAGGGIGSRPSLAPFTRGSNSRLFVMQYTG
ncbi:MAG: hypothetical protein HZA02_06480 [Nitrospinae bacterium]|nr:hypothetical protein [Nitrospinota bacterium]